MTEQLWRGEFGDEYTERNAAGRLAQKRYEFWASLQDQYPFGSVLEVGCNAGANLAAITFSPSMFRPRVAPIAGVDVNVHALMEFKTLTWDTWTSGRYVYDPRRHDVRVAPATALPFGSRAFELVFTSGVLIHLDDEQLSRAMDEIVRVSRRYVLAIEYFAPTRVEVPYRGHAGALWKRPYDRLYQERFPQLALCEQGVLGPDDGWDDCHWWLFKKC